MGPNRPRRRRSTVGPWHRGGPRHEPGLPLPLFLEPRGATRRAGQRRLRCPHRVGSHRVGSLDHGATRRERRAVARGHARVPSVGHHEPPSILAGLRDAAPQAYPQGVWRARRGATPRSRVPGGRRRRGRSRRAHATSRRPRLLPRRERPRGRARSFMPCLPPSLRAPRPPLRAPPAAQGVRRRARPRASRSEQARRTGACARADRAGPLLPSGSWSAP